MPSAGGLAEKLFRLRQQYDTFQALRRGADTPGNHRLSIRHGLFRIPDSPADDNSVSLSSDDIWRETLRSHVVPSMKNVAALAGCCKDPPDGPALVIPFTTPLFAGRVNMYNYFGWPRGQGDDGFFNGSLTGEVLTGVKVKLFNFPLQLNNYPLVYLLPAGLDLFRSPSWGAPEDQRVNIRSWNIRPSERGRLSEIESRNIGPGWSPVFEGYAFSPWAIRDRAFLPFIAESADSPPVNGSNSDVTRQHYGRSVYNTQWYLIVPIPWLLPDASESPERILRLLLGDSAGGGINEIQVLFQTRASE